MIRDGKLVAQTSLEEFTSGDGATTAGPVRRPGRDGDGCPPRPGRPSAATATTALLVRGIGAAEEIGDLALRRGIAIHELAPQQQSLEERFIELMGDEEDSA